MIQISFIEHGIEFAAIKETEIMKEKDHKNRKIDPQLDVPAEANTEHHINFVRLEEDGRLKDDEGKDTERRKEWEEGLEEGRERKNEGSD